MKICLTKIIFKDEEDKRNNLRKAYRFIEDMFSNKNITFVDKGLIIEYSITKSFYED
jgi:hypothetical protein